MTGQTITALLRLGTFALAGALLFACSSSVASPEPTQTLAIDTATPAPEPTATPTPRPPAPRPDAQPFPESLRLSSEELFEQIAAARNTPIKVPVDMFVLTREQARAFYSNQSSDGSSNQPGPGSPGAERIDPRQEVYELLGLVPARKPPESGQAQPPSLHESQVENLISLITGFYSPEHNALYVVESATGSRSTIVHELTHALQYQYADLAAIERQRANDWDATTALLHVLEGDAVNTEIQILGFSTRQSYRQPVCFTIPAAQRAGTPYVVERELDTWYEDGLCFVQAVTKERSIEALFADLPTTTEQILHPEKYLAGEGRKPVSLPSLSTSLGPEWRRAAGGTLGEFMLQNLLLVGLRANRPLVQAAAAGWGGDTWNLYVADAARLLHTSVTWDTPGDAAEFWSALLRSLANQGASTPAADALSFDAQLGGITWRATINGGTTTLVVSNNAEAAAQVALP